MALPFFGSKGNPITNPRAKRAQQAADDIYDPQKTVVPQPAGETPVTPAAAPAAPAAPAQQQPSQSTERTLSYTGATYDGHNTIVLYTMEEGKPPIPVEQVIKNWQSLPEKHRFDILAVDHYVYCYDVVEGQIQVVNVVPPEGTCKDIIAKHEDSVREYMAKLTGKKPEPVSGAITAEALLALSKDQWKQLFSGMNKDQVRQILNPGHDRLTELKAQEKAQQQPPKSGEPAPQPTPKPQPAPAPKPAAQPVGRNGKKAWPTNIGK